MKYLLLTIENMRKRRLSCSSSGQFCIFCNQLEESSTHLFLIRSFLDLLDYHVKIFFILEVGPTLLLLGLLGERQVKKDLKVLYDCVNMSMIWSIWSEQVLESCLSLLNLLIFHLVNLTEHVGTKKRKRNVAKFSVNNAKFEKH